MKLYVKFATLAANRCVTGQQSMLFLSHCLLKLVSNSVKSRSLLDKLE